MAPYLPAYGFQLGWRATVVPFRQGKHNITNIPLYIYSLFFFSLLQELKQAKRTRQEYALLENPDALRSVFTDVGDYRRRNQGLYDSYSAGDFVAVLAAADRAANKGRQFWIAK